MIILRDSGEQIAFERLFKTARASFYCGGSPEGAAVRLTFSNEGDKLTFRMHPTKLLCTLAPGSALVLMLPPTYTLLEESIVNLPAMWEWSA